MAYLFTYIQQPLDTTPMVARPSTTVHDVPLSTSICCLIKAASLICCSMILGCSAMFAEHIWPVFILSGWLIGLNSLLDGLLGVGLLVMMIWLEPCMTYSSSCHHHFHHPLLQKTPANPGSPGKWPLKRRERRFVRSRRDDFGCLWQMHLFTLYWSS